MCTIDWGFIAAWIAALSTSGLLWMAWKGFEQWKDQFTKKRDHDLAVRVLQTLSASKSKVNEIRQPGVLLSDFDLPLPTDQYDNQPDWAEYKNNLTRYRSRKMHMANVIAQRDSVLDEAEIVWGDAAAEIRDLVKELVEKELELDIEVWKFINGFRPDDIGNDQPDLDVLFSPADPQTQDEYADAYDQKVDSIHGLLGSRIRME